MLGFSNRLAAVRLSPVLVAGSLFLVACSGGPATDGGNAASSSGASSSSGQELTVDEAAILQAAVQRASQLNRVSSSVITSQHMGMSVLVYVNTNAEAAFRGVDPEATNQAAAMPSGTIIVKEQQDDMGVVQALTIMAKGPQGYDPDHNDWWWGMADPQGNIIDGTRGKVAMCFNCHGGRAASDYVYGVETANQTP